MLDQPEALAKNMAMLGELKQRRASLKVNDGLYLVSAVWAGIQQNATMECWNYTLAVSSSRSWQEVLSMPLMFPR